MLNRVLAALSLVCFCCLISACAGKPAEPVQQTVNPETVPGAKDGTGPATNVVE